METARVWLPWRSSLLAFFKMGSNILNNGYRAKTGTNKKHLAGKNYYLSRYIWNTGEIFKKSINCKWWCFGLSPCSVDSPDNIVDQ